MPGKNHSASGGLQNLCDDNVDLLAEERTSVFDNDHRAVFHISYTLIDLFSFLYDIDDQFFSRKQDSVRDGHPDTFQLRQFMQMLFLQPLFQCSQIAFGFPGDQNPVVLISQLTNQIGTDLADPVG